ncbi:cytidine deaminase [Clostridium minihomine]|uniref:cytidine deaminase n=1 Tax=Clostridium minihomine TaxID=2045012 RepID=UPI000C77383E|nr:cytidine deaminase [Clostridium minihomine]
MAKEMAVSDQELVCAAIEARETAYVPYSGFSVGAALLTSDGKIYKGGNIENAAYTPSNCAERTAFFKAVSEGEKNFAAIAIVGGKHEKSISDYCAPCGVCRQVMMEFCDPETFRILLAKNSEEWKVYTLKELLPLGFSGKDLDK